MQVGTGEQGVVVEHLLEMGDGPGGIDRIAVKAAAEDVVDASPGHRAQGAERHLGLAPQEQQLDYRSLRELRRASKSPVEGIEGLLEPGHRRVECVLAQRLGGGRKKRPAGQALAQVLAARADLLASL